MVCELRIFFTFLNGRISNDYLGIDIIALILLLGPQSLTYLLFGLLRKSLPTSNLDCGDKTAWLHCHDGYVAGKKCLSGPHSCCRQQITSKQSTTAVGVVSGETLYTKKVLNSSFSRKPLNSHQWKRDESCPQPKPAYSPQRLPQSPQGLGLIQSHKGWSIRQRQSETGIHQQNGNFC